MGSSCEVPLRHWPPFRILEDVPPVRILEDVFSAPAKWSSCIGVMFTERKSGPVGAWNAGHSPLDHQSPWVWMLPPVDFQTNDIPMLSQVFFKIPVTLAGHHEIIGMLMQPFPLPRIFHAMHPPRVPSRAFSQHLSDWLLRMRLLIPV